MQGVRPLQKAWRDPGGNRTNIRVSGVTKGLWTSIGRFCSPAANQATHAGPKKIVTATGEFLAPLL
jgi:hypothetical protein